MDGFWHWAFRDGDTGQYRFMNAVRFILYLGGGERG